MSFTRRHNVPDRLTDLAARGKSCFAPARLMLRHTAAHWRHHEKLLLLLIVRRPVENRDFAVRFALERRGVFSDLFAPPPISVQPLRAQVREPILIKNGADFARRRIRKWIEREELQDVRIVFQQAFLGPDHETGIAPRSERSEP